MPSLRQVSRADLFAVFKTEAMVRFIENLISSVETSDTTTILAALNAHIVDAVDAHQASAIGATPGGSRAANTVQGQLGELDTGKDPAGTAASAVSAHVALADPHTQYALDTDLSAYVPITRTVNAKPLNANISLTASDVGALSPPAGTALLKANSGGALANAVAGTDYLAPPAGTALLKANSGGALANATAGTDYTTPTGSEGLSNKTITGSSLAGSTVAMTGGVTSSGTAGIGYATGAGGSVTQATSKATAVTLNKTTGEITLNAAALAAATIVTFVFNNSTIAATDQIVCTHHATGAFGSYTINARATGAGTASIAVRNNSAASLSEAIVIKFSVLKSVTA